MSYQDTKRHRGNLNIYYQVKSQSEKVVHCMIPTLCHPRKGKNYGNSKQICVPSVWERGQDE